MNNENKIEGLEISTSNKSNRITDLYLKDEFIEKLIFPFKRFDITALEYKPFTRFTLAKNLDDLTQNKLSQLINSILKDRAKGCFILKTNIQNKKIKQIVNGNTNTVYVNPINSLIFVLNKLKKDKINLNKNFYVFTGSTVGVVPILGKGKYEGNIDKLGSVKAIIN